MKKARTMFCVGCRADLSAKSQTVANAMSRGPVSMKALRAPARVEVTIASGGGPWDQHLDASTLRPEQVANVNKVRASVAVCAECLEDACNALARANGITPATSSPVRASGLGARRTIHDLNVSLARVLTAVAAKLLLTEEEN